MPAIEPDQADARDVDQDDGRAGEQAPARLGEHRPMRNKNEVRLSTRKIRKRAELERFQGRGFARLAVDLHLKCLSPEGWAELMRHQVATLAMRLSSDDERRW